MTWGPGAKTGHLTRERFRNLLEWLLGLLGKALGRLKRTLATPRSPQRRTMASMVAGVWRRADYPAAGQLTSQVTHSVVCAGYPREVFKDAIRHGAAAIVVVHNHPSGDPEPNRDEIVIGEQLRAAGRLVGSRCSITSSSAMERT